MNTNTRSREQILGRVREALSHQREEGGKGTSNPGDIFAEIDDDLTISFAENFKTTKGELIYCESEAEFYDNLYKLKSKQNWQHVFAWGDELADNIANNGIEIHTNDQEFINNAEVGITYCECLIARTGSIMISSKLGGNRRLSIYPETHVCVAYTSQIVKDIGEGITIIRNRYEHQPSMISLVSGPSRTADIEKTLVMGAHGPKSLILFLIDDSTD